MALMKRQSLLSAGVLSACATLWSAALGLVAVPVMVHGLDLAAYGIYTLAFTIAGFGSYLDLGLAWTTSRFVAEADAQNDTERLSATIRAAILYHSATGLVFVAIVLVFGRWIAEVLLRFHQQDEQMILQVMRIAAASFLVSSVAGVFINALRGTRRFASATTAAISGLTISVAGAALMARLRFGVLAAASAQLVGALAGLGIALIACHELLLPFASRRAIRTQFSVMLKFSVWNYLNRLIQMGTSELDKVFVGRMLGAGFLPFYMVPYGLAQKINSVAAPAVSAIYPVATVGQYERNKFLKQYLSSSRVVHVLTASGALAMFFWGPRFLASWVGPEMGTQGAFFLRTFSLGFWVLSVGSFDGGCMEGWNRPRTTFIIVAISVLIALPVVLLAMPALGAARAAAIGVMTWQIATGLGQIFCWQRLCRYPFAYFFRRICLPVLEMAAIGFTLTVVVGPLLLSRLSVMAGLPFIAVVLAGYGFLRAFSKDERRLIISRVTFGASELKNGTATNPVST